MSPHNLTASGKDEFNVNHRTVILTCAKTPYQHEGVVLLTNIEGASLTSVKGQQLSTLIGIPPHLETIRSRCPLMSSDPPVTGVVVFHEKGYDRHG